MLEALIAITVLVVLPLTMFFLCYLDEPSPPFKVFYWGDGQWGIEQFRHLGTHGFYSPLCQFYESREAAEKDMQIMMRENQ